MQDIWWKSCDGIEMRKMIKENTKHLHLSSHLFHCFVFHEQGYLANLWSSKVTTFDTFIYVWVARQNMSKYVSNSDWNQLAHGQQGYQPQQSRQCLEKSPYSMSFNADNAFFKSFQIIQERCKKCCISKLPYAIRRTKGQIVLSKGLNSTLLTWQISYKSHCVFSLMLLKGLQF